MAGSAPASASSAAVRPAPGTSGAVMRASSTTCLWGCSSGVGGCLLRLGLRSLFGFLNVGELRNVTLSRVSTTDHQGGSSRAVTFRNSFDGAVQIALGFFERKQQVNISPVGEHFFQHQQLRRILPLHFTQLALVGDIIGGCYILVVAICLPLSRSRAGARTASAAAAGASAAC